MGAWGVGIFEDDTSCDLIDEAMDDGALTLIEEAMEVDMDQYIDFEDAHKIIVSAALIDTIVNATDHHYPTENFDEWLKDQPHDEIAAFKDDIALRLHSVLADSELSELWQDEEESFPQWKAIIARLIQSLEK